MSLHSVNLPLAWVGYEKTLVEVFKEIGLTDEEISSFLSGPAFLPWNRFGNIQGSWGGNLSSSWIEGQFELQKKIVARMVELGMTPALPAFSGFVPRAIRRVLPNASVIDSNDWNSFGPEYSNDTFLEPFDENFAKMQKSFLSKQQAAFGNITHIYVLDQYNEMNPTNGDTSYLRGISGSTIQSLKSVDTDAVWLMQGWLFYLGSSFWTDDRIEAYLGGVSNTDMMVLDIFSESVPQWQRTHSYYGKPWLWCMVHAFGGNMNLYGQILNLTLNPTEALAESDSLVGFGLAMEGQGTNELMYDLLLEQAWSKEPIETGFYFQKWVTARYSGSNSIPNGLYRAWDILRTTVYNNTNLTLTMYAPKSILELHPENDLLRPGLTVNPYNSSDLIQAWKYLFNAAKEEPSLWKSPTYQFDIVDITRQVLANAFTPLYTSLLKSYSDPNTQTSGIRTTGNQMLALLNSLNSVLATNENFHLSKWTNQARAWAENESEAAFYEYDARNQITLWGPNGGALADYASKQWAGLVETYFLPRWKMYVEYLIETPEKEYNATEIDGRLREFELSWQWETSAGQGEVVKGGGLRGVLEEVVRDWPAVFGH